jgi:MFS family permease
MRPLAPLDPGPLVKNAAFLHLWVAQTISVFGSEFTRLALPIVAVLTLHAAPGQMGVLAAVQTAPFLLLGLIAGVWVDRLPRRPVLIAGDLGRAALLGLIPLTAAAGVLGMSHLYVIGFLVGVLTVFFDIAYQAYVPALVGPHQIIEGNSKLEASRSMAQLSGPGIAGVVIQAFSAPVAIVVDALSFVCSAAFVSRIRRREDPPKRRRAPLLEEAQEGIVIVLGNRLLRPIAACTGTANFFDATWSALYILFATRELGLSPASIGLIASAGNVAGLLGTMLAGWLAGRAGIGRVIVGSALVFGLSGVPMALATPASAFLLLTLSRLLASLGVQIYNINQVSLRQAITPHHLQGRMNATMRFLVWGTMPLGGLVGGALGQVLGLRSTIVIAVVGELLAFLWVFLSPVRALRTIPPAATPA